MASTKDQVHEYYDFILPLVLQAGKVLTDAEQVEVEFKKDIWDLVTVHDRKIEEVLIQSIKDKYPSHKYIGEEDTESKKSTPKLTDDPTWIIDPIDGTANFVRGMPITGISVGLTINKEQWLGIVYNPYFNELFTAIKGEGAFLNGKRIHTSGCKEIAKSVIGYEITIARRNEYYYNLYMYRLKHLMPIIQGIRSLGCIILGLCYVACGRTDAYQCDGQYPWDLAAGGLILTEAGGHLVDSFGKDLDLMEPNFLGGATKELVDQYMEVERKADEERINADELKRKFSP
ncbi:unnamed protein product [Ceutorhynchus assimilis]|uniref:Inositol-1-monophosphatase n=1 Tax=Ceutorhynchus assimilis TaxID=467358 RepID=A0A9N9QEQ6_9CUCU|nr:unnamed protein product [Ceutorhynchus assimilis]